MRVLHLPLHLAWNPHGDHVFTCLLGKEEVDSSNLFNSSKF